ncbi:MAG TPA: hypothetical protein VHS59_11735 [Bacillota bacterium]|nr:hypothetical protein [Bacillota bacterium]
MSKAPDNKKQIYAFITMQQDRLLGGAAVGLLARSQEEQQALTNAIAHALKAEVVQLPTGDNLVFSTD